MAIPRNEQETVITWDKESKTWNFYTSDPVHMNKWKKHLVETIETEELGMVVTLEGKIKGSVSVRGESKMTDEQKAKTAERFKAIREAKAAEVQDA